MSLLGDSKCPQSPKAVLQPDREVIPMYRSKPVLLMFGLLLLFAAGAADAKGQAVYGSISGTVTDASGAVVSGATVTITSIDRGTSDTVTTNDSGLYLKERL